MDPFCYLSFMLVFVMLSCLFFAALWSLLGGAGLLALFCVVFCCFSMWCPGPIAVLGRINS